MRNVTGYKQASKGLDQEGSSCKLKLFLVLPGFTGFSLLTMVLACTCCQ